VARLAWATDIHLDHANKRKGQVDKFYRRICESGADALVITGDIASAIYVGAYLDVLAKKFRRPVYFVLGNHDFYHGAIDEVRSDVRALCEDSEYLIYLPDEGPVALDTTTCLVGVDGWGDGGYGNRDEFAYLADYDLIADYFDAHKGIGIGLRKEILEVMDKHGQEEVSCAAEQMKLAAENFQKIVFATHVPPFPEASWHQGNLSEPAWQVGFVCRAVGDYLRAFAKAHPNNDITVICGHTHSPGKATLAPNLRAITGAAKYGHPALQPTLGL